MIAKQPETTHHDVIGNDDRREDLIQDLPRRSTRSTKGQHSNHEHLPKSILSDTTAEAMVTMLTHQNAPPTFEHMG